MKILQNIDYQIKSFPKPQMTIVPLKVANGDAALPIVKMNEIVKCGQVIAKSAGFNSVDVFSPVYGKVIGFDTYPLSDHSKSYCVYIENMEQSKNTKESEQSAESDKTSKTNTIKKEKPFTFNRLESNSKALILKRLADCGVIDHNGDSVSDKLSKQHKILCIPCFDPTLHSCENTAVLASDNFDNIYNSAKKIATIFELPVVFVCQKGDEITGIDKVYDLKTELKNAEFYKLFVKKIDANKVFSKYFASRFSAEELAICNEIAKAHNENNPKNEKMEDAENLQQSKGDLLNDILSASGTKVNIRLEGVTILNNNQDLKSSSNCNDSHIKVDTNAKNTDKFGKMRVRAISLSPYKTLENMLVLTPVDLLHIYRAIECGMPQTTNIATFGGAAINSNGVYEICSGCTLEHIKNALGGTHSEQDIEDEKTDAYDAIEEFFDARTKYKEEKDESKKIELKKAMQQKKRIAKALALNFVKTSKKKLKTCLGQIAFDDPENGETFGDFRAVFELRNHGIYYLTCKQC